LGEELHDVVFVILDDFGKVTGQKLFLKCLLLLFNTGTGIVLMDLLPGGLVESRSCFRYFAWDKKKLMFEGKDFMEEMDW
jgi:hypothetical protein